MAHKINMSLDANATLVTCQCGDFAFTGVLGLAQVMATLHLLEEVANGVAGFNDIGQGETD